MQHAKTYHVEFNYFLFYALQLLDHVQYIFCNKIDKLFLIYNMYRRKSSRMLISIFFFNTEFLAESNFDF